MCSSNCKKITVDILLILISLINFGEQIYIYILTKSANLKNEDEKLFFYVLLGVSGLSLLKALTANQRIQIFISAFIELIKAIAYLLLFNGILYNFQTMYTMNFFSFLLNNIIVLIIGLLFIVDLLLFILVFILVGQTEDKKTWIKRIIDIFIEILLFLGLNLSPALFLFVQSTSRFRNTYFEILTIISLYFPSEASGILPCTFPAFGNYFRSMWKLIKKSYSESNENNTNTREPMDKLKNSNMILINKFIHDFKESLHKKYSCIYRY
jgi:hypothetical protein